MSDDDEPWLKAEPPPVAVQVEMILTMADLARRIEAICAEYIHDLPPAD